MQRLVKWSLSVAGRVLRRTPLARSKLLNDLQAEMALRFHKSDTAAVGPFRIKFSPSDRVIAKKLVLYGEYDKAQIDLLCSFIKPGDDVLDIGANIGLYSVYLSRAVGPEGRVLAIEPDPQNLELLTTNLKANNCDNVLVAPLCLGNENGEVTLFRDAGNSGGSSLWSGGKDAGCNVVAMRIGDEVISEFGFRPKVAKIDVEGAEPLVLAGLRKYRPSVFLFEYCTDAMEGLGHNPVEFLEALVADGYSLAAVDALSGALQEGSVKEVVSLMDHSPHDYVYGNMLAIHQDCRLDYAKDKDRVSTRAA